MSYQVARDGTTIGTFTDEELVEAVEEGKVLITDDAWTEGMQDWVTVESLIDVEEIEEQEDEVPPTAPVSRPVPVPLGKPTPSGHAATSHYHPVESKAPVAPPAQKPAFMPSAMVLGPTPPVMVKGGLSPAAGRYGTAGVAIASIVLGILSFVLLAVTAIPAIICGHKALDRIRRTGGAVSGKGIAIVGLTLGYLMLVVTVALGAWFILRGKPH